MHKLFRWRRSAAAGSDRSQTVCKVQSVALSCCVRAAVPGKERGGGGERDGHEGAISGQRKCHGENKRAKGSSCERVSQDGRNSLIKERERKTITGRDWIIGPVLSRCAPHNLPVCLLQQRRPRRLLVCTGSDRRPLRPTQVRRRLTYRSGSRPGVAAAPLLDSTFSQSGIRSPTPLLLLSCVRIQKALPAQALLSEKQSCEW